MFRLQYISEFGHNLFWEETVNRLPKEGERVLKHDVDIDTEVDGRVSQVITTVFDYIDPEALKAYPQYLVIVLTNECKIRGVRY